MYTYVCLSHTVTESIPILYLASEVFLDNNYVFEYVQYVYMCVHIHTYVVYMILTTVKHFVVFTTALLTDVSDQ